MTSELRSKLIEEIEDISELKDGDVILVPEKGRLERLINLATKPIPFINSGNNALLRAVRISALPLILEETKATVLLKIGPQFKAKNNKVRYAFVFSPTGIIWCTHAQMLDLSKSKNGALFVEITSETLAEILAAIEEKEPDQNFFAGGA